MAQATTSPVTSTNRGLLAEVSRQMVHLVALLALADVAIRRAAAGARGLRLSTEHPILGFWTDIGDRLGEWPRDALLVGALLTALFKLPALVRTRRPLPVLMAVGALLLALPILLHRIDPTLVDLPSNLLVTVLLAGATTSFLVRTPGGLRLGLMAASLGATLCSLWMGGTALDLPRSLLNAVEMAGESLVLLALATAHLCLTGKAQTTTGRAQSTRTWGWLLWGLISVGTAWVFLALPEAGLHVLRHLFHLGQAGLPAPMMGILAALALASLGRLVTLGTHARGQALVLFLILACARGPGGELVALRICSAVLLLQLSLPSPRPEEKVSTFAPVGG